MEPELTSSQKVKDIEETGREWIEGVLGQRLDDEDQIYLMVYKHGSVPEESGRRAAFERIKALCEKAHRHAEEQGVTAEQADAAVREAIGYVRRHKV